MSSATVPGGASGRRPLAIVLAVVGILAVIIGVMFMVVTGLPHFMVAGSHVHSSSGHHLARGATALVVGVLLLGGAWWVNKSKAAS
ncbi:MAG TPA: hypothetical protein VMV07_06875 [Streptosporangiaceae bacterium]|nr:hypothetical protein [Streptosporangiaceae bacterium]